MQRERTLIFGIAGFRAVAVGFAGVIFALHLSTLGFGAGWIGLAVSLGLGGCAVGTFAATFVADRLGRRATLFCLSLLMLLGGIALSFVTDPSVLLVSIFLGMVNGMGRDRGAGLTIEQAILPKTTTEGERTKVFAWYNVVVDAGHAGGALLGVFPAFLRARGFATVPSYQWSWLLYTLFSLLAAILVLGLSKSVELKERPKTLKLSPESRRIVAKFAALSGLDSLGGGFLTTALLGYWFFRRFGVDEGFLGPLFFVTRILNGFSHLGAAALSNRIGLVNTMVFTHIPSSLLLMTVPIAPNLPIAVILFLLRESLVEMDVPTRQSYIVAVVKEEERTKAAGITNLTRSVAWATAPAIAGGLMRSFSLSAPLYVGPGLKIFYDLLLYRAFRHIRPPEEQTSVLK